MMANVIGCKGEQIAASDKTEPGSTVQDSAKKCGPFRIVSTKLRPWMDFSIKLAI